MLPWGFLFMAMGCWTGHALCSVRSAQERRTRTYPASLTMLRVSGTNLISNVICRCASVHLGQRGNKKEQAPCWGGGTCP
jgi:primase-polymerase (primpol)-like protein